MNDQDSPIPCAAITMRVLRQPSDRDRLSMKISRPIAINSRPSIDADRELLRMPRGARYVVRLSSLKSTFCARDGFDDRVDSGPRNRSRPDRIRRSISCHVSCTGKTVWEHSPTQRKGRKILSINRGMNSSINCLYPLSYRNHTWRPTRAPTWTRGLLATRPRPVRLLRGPPGRCHVALVPRRNPDWSHAPRHPGPCATSAAATSPCR